MLQHELELLGRFPQLQLRLHLQKEKFLFHSIGTFYLFHIYSVKINKKAHIPKFKPAHYLRRGFFCLLSNIFHASRNPTSSHIVPKSRKSTHPHLYKKKSGFLSKRRNVYFYSRKSIISTPKSHIAQQITPFSQKKNGQIFGIQTFSHHKLYTR